MCGIAGIVGRLPAEAPSALDRMLDAQRHRGPDDEGRFRDSDCLLGHRRLSIIDLEGGRQPIANEDETLWLVCNGEIYNYESLRERLLAQGHRFRTSSDSEVILHLYEEKGTGCLEDLRGMFAFALWDTRRQRLFAARDRLGQKPFYYHQRNGSLYFSSEIKGLLAALPDLRRMNPEALDEYFTLRIITPPRSLFEGVHKLPPAHYLSYSPGEAPHIERYWDLPYLPKLEGDDEALVDQLEAAIIETLKLHMVSDVPVGAFLSGGLDSSLVVAMTQAHVSSEPIDTFTIGLPYGRYDESDAARLVAERYGTRHHEWKLLPSIADLLPTLVQALDEPSDPLSVCTWLIAEKASRHVKVVLGGDGGDELFGGYDRYYGNLYASHYRRIPESIRRFAISPLLGLIPDGNWYKSKAHQIKWLHEMSFLESADRYARSLNYFYLGTAHKRTLYGERLRQAVADFDPMHTIREGFLSAKADHDIDRMLHSDSFARLPDHPVFIQDRMTMAHGLEARAPFMDHVLAEFAARLPVRMKVRGRRLRYIQYRLAQRYLPDALLARPKQGFSSALPYMLKDEYTLLYELFLNDMHLVRDGWLRKEGVDRLLAGHRSGRHDHGNRLWLLLNSEVWYRMHIEQESVETLDAQVASARGTGTKAAVSGT